MLEIINMGIVYKQSLKNTIFLLLGFFIGGINTLFLYTNFLEDAYYGLITFLLSTAAILLPLVVFGMQNTVVKFYSNYKTKKDKDEFLIISLLFPLIVIVPLAIIAILFYEHISNYISRENPLIKNYTYLIFLIALFMGYFELFYAWSKVKMQSVFGNFIKEVFQRFCTTFLLIAVYFNWLTNETFIYAIVIVYGLRMLIMLVYALSIYTPKLRFKLPQNFKEIFKYSFYIILSTSAGGILLEIDKFMIPQIEVGLEKVAFYAVGVYIATVVGIPARAMLQIATPITAKELNINNLNKVEKLYKSSSLNLLITGGLLFLLINLNVVDLYKIIDKPEYATAIHIVLMISIAKLVELLLGTNAAILTNSKYYKVYFYFSLTMALSVYFLNDWLITLYGGNGAALATLIVVVIYGAVKLIYVNYKLKMHPITKKTFIILGIIAFIYVLFSFWKVDLHPIFNIIFKTLFISLIYINLVYKFKLSVVMNNKLDKLLNRKN
ncbi:MAG: oligosaccharide flippase family protein [Flavobacteriaceae bacterium]|nr:oligosaccharide flippase family protein [Flavobacteriaceae bacterium]